MEDGEGEGRAIRLRYVLTRDEDGWPPTDSEYLWARLLSPGVAKVDNIPWFAQNVALGDFVSVTPVGDDVFDPSERIRWSGNCTIRIIVLSDRAGNSLQDVVQEFLSLGPQAKLLSSME
jgi:hypothetical protein